MYACYSNSICANWDLSLDPVTFDDYYSHSQVAGCTHTCASTEAGWLANSWWASSPHLYNASYSRGEGVLEDDIASLTAAYIHFPTGPTCYHLRHSVLVHVKRGQAHRLVLWLRVCVWRVQVWEYESVLTYLYMFINNKKVWVCNTYCTGHR